ncbi:MAG: M64 family metallopeptidase [Thermomicrobiales bacterium]
MTASDGSVGGVTKIVDHGSDSIRWNLVIVGDGYQASELPRYHTDCQAFVDRIRLTPPYNDLWCGINVHRVDVTSTDSGADDPTTCAGGTGATPATYFDSTFCSPWGTVHLDRLLTSDHVLAQSVARGAVPLMHVTLVLVNSAKYGGSGGEIAVCSTNTQAAEIAIHEIGHTAFDLADEYEGTSAAPASEPPRPNVTIDPNRATNKWRDLVLATTPMPSACNAGSTCGCVAPATPAAGGVTGAFEGGLYSSCGVYRPAAVCYMRDYSPFCTVCTRVIRTALAMFQPAESLSLISPSLAFTDVPEGVGGIGVTNYRAVALEVIACRTLSFSITSGPTGGFGLPFGPASDATSGAYTAVDTARIWISYTSTTAGATSSGSVDVTCDQTGQTWTIPITANTVARPRTEVVLVLDRSGSMQEDAGDGTTKVGKLRESAQIFVDTMLPGDGIGIVRFDHTVQRLMDVEDVGALITGSGRTTAIGHITGSGLDPAGNTSIGGGVEEGRSTLDDGAAAASPPYAVQAMIVLSDGIENVPPMLADVSGSISANTFAIGLGLPYNISVAALNTLTQANSGYLLITGSLTTDQRTLLTKYFLQILAGITSANVVLDPHGDIGVGEEHRIPFSISETDYGLDGIVLCPIPDLLTYELESPDGQRFDAATIQGIGTGQKIDRPGISFYRTSFPLDPANEIGTHPGTWHVVLGLSRSHPSIEKLWGYFENGRLPYDVVVHTYSNLVFHANAYQFNYEPGSSIKLVATLREYDVHVGDRATVWAEITQPDFNTFTTPLSHKGEEYVGTFDTSATGVYQIRIRAVGKTFEGTPFTREQTLTAVSAYERKVPPSSKYEYVEDKPEPNEPLRDLISALDLYFERRAPS